MVNAATFVYMSVSTRTICSSQLIRESRPFSHTKTIVLINGADLLKPASLFLLREVVLIPRRQAMP